MPYYTWYLGFLSSFNQARYGNGEAGVNYHITPDRLGEDLAFLQAYSIEHPARPFVQAALALIRMHSLRPTR